MRTFIFKDRAAHVIIIEIDDDGNRAVASHRAEPVGWIEFEHCSSSAEAPVALLDAYVVPEYRRNGIAHTLIAYVSREMGGPIQVRIPSHSRSAGFDTLCSNLMHEGLLVR
ncbi:GNAT family N-acetyltransferase [Paraburkholderia diazotrophica]|uniref:Acetyltransferase (GNAT) family protein n=1 Tax=Paraburkholderia diazotrophica TaxID=667676 RepID=A0A1H7E667_9BURK|nr:GNAT family N-acetyltransferase [Paraburkholderia diazotrophica]SEK08557.1 Acetyltransferase (GNAT) family protein [Paraburkholderia diazotrophica]